MGRSGAGRTWVALLGRIVAVSTFTLTFAEETAHPAFVLQLAFLLFAAMGSYLKVPLMEWLLCLTADFFVIFKGMVCEPNCYFFLLGCCVRSCVPSIPLDR